MSTSTHHQTPTDQVALFGEGPCEVCGEVGHELVHGPNATSHPWDRWRLVLCETCCEVGAAYRRDYSASRRGRLWRTKREFLAAMREARGLTQTADHQTCAGCGEPMAGQLRYCPACREATADAIRAAEERRAQAKQAGPPSND